MKRILPFLALIFFLAGCIWAQDRETEMRRALRQLVERADSGDAKALYDLAYLHDIGYDSIEKDSLRSTALYLLSAEKGYAPARNFIGFRYYRGETVKRDIDSAFYWIRLAADAGDITAAANLGYLLTETEEAAGNADEAEKWLTMAAEAGVTGAQEKLSDMKAGEWAALTPDSALVAGMRYYLDKAPVMGVRLIEIAGESGNPKALALLGDAYSKGLGVAYDHQKSIEYFYSAARLGDPSAQFIIAELLDIFPDALNYLNPQLSEEENAFFWYSKAAEAGITDSETAYLRLFSF